MKTETKIVGFLSLKECKRFWLRTIISWTKFWNGTPCWEWVGSKNEDGYGFMTRGKRGDNRAIKVHRLSFEAYVGEIPVGFTVDHLCRNRACVNPGHLDAVTHVVNVMRGIHPTTINRDKTHCNNGHLLEGNNLLSYRIGKRECLECSRIQSLAYYHRTKGKGRWKWRKKCLDSTN